MRGVILAGGTGSRLMPLTKTINKHLLPVGQTPMIYYPLGVLRNNGIQDITIVSSPSGVGQIAALLGSGSEFNCKFSYRVQDQPGGIVDALKCAKGSKEDVAVILGDNVFFPSPKITDLGRLDYAHVYLSRSAELTRFGVPTLDDYGSITKITEKPSKPASCYAVTGLYVFSHTVFDVESGPEITDLLNIYADNKALVYSTFSGFWGDAGTFSGLQECFKEK